MEIFYKIREIEHSQILFRKEYEEDKYGIKISMHHKDIEVSINISFDSKSKRDVMFNDIDSIDLAKLKSGLIANIEEAEKQEVLQHFDND